jgi:site-specific recombinase XerD
VGFPTFLIDNFVGGVDLHALRHTYGTMLINSGADIKSVQTLMRHSSPVLTLGIYLHSDKGRLRNAVAALPTPTPAKIVEQAIAANA